MIKLSREKLIILVLAVLLIAAVCYICVAKHKSAEAERESAAYRQGAQQGYEYAILQVMQESIGCKPVSVYTQNKTMNLIDVACLNLGLQGNGSL